MYIKTRRNGKEFLFNRRAYMSADNTKEELKKLEEELKNVKMSAGECTMYQLSIFTEFFGSRELPKTTATVLSELQIGEECLIKALISDAHVKKVSKSFVSVKWRSCFAENKDGGKILFY